MGTYERTKTDEAAFTQGTDKVKPAGFIRSDNPEELDDGQVGAARVSKARILYVTLRDDEGGATSFEIDAEGLAAAFAPGMDRIADLLGILASIDGGRGSATHHTQRVSIAADDPVLEFLGRVAAATERAPMPMSFPVSKRESLSSDRDSVDASGSAITILGGVIESRFQLAMTAMQENKTVSTTAVRLLGTNAHRKAFLIQHIGGGTLFVGYTSSVAASGAGIGHPIGPAGFVHGSVPGVYGGEVWGIYSVAQSAANVVVSDFS